MPPDHACNVSSVAGRSAHGPSRPKGVIDVTADLPPHLAETLATLGFEQMAGDMLPLDRPKPSQTPAAKQRKVSAAARDRRRERRGERRSRGQSDRRR